MVAAVESASSSLAGLLISASRLLICASSFFVSKSSFHKSHFFFNLKYSLEIHGNINISIYC